MGTTLREKAERLRNRAASDPQPPAPADEGSIEGDVVDDDYDVDIEAAPTDAEVADDAIEDDAEEADDSNVVSIADRAVDKLSDDEVEKFLAHQASGPGVAGLAATRETKRSQVQYDGKTADGYVVRVWAPEGAPMITKATLDIVD